MKTRTGGRPPFERQPRGSQRRTDRPGRREGAEGERRLAGRYPLPAATAAVLQRRRGESHPFVGSNLSLALNKLVGPWPDSGRWTMRPDDRRAFLNACARACSDPEAEAVRSAFAGRWRAMLASYRSAGWEVREHTARPAWRFVSGLGMASPLEVNLVVHRIGGFPYIPGSSIKGAVRAYAEGEVGQPPARPDAEAGGLDPRIVEVFGAHDRQGQVVFFDAIPANAPRLELDVINVHYPEYYSDKKPPADWQSPVPVLFLAVGRSTSFTFAVASRSATLADQAMDWLRRAVETSGLGGKTAAGYGYFEPVGRRRGG